MESQSRSIQTILKARLEVTQEIAAENVEHLRLSQIASGLMVLDMKDEEDGTTTSGRDEERMSNYNALERSMERINKLEASLKQLDLELRTAIDEEGSAP